MKKILITFFVLSALISCGVLPQKNSFYTTMVPVELGSVGEKQKNIRKSTFNVFGVAVFKQGVKANVTFKPFTKPTYKKYKKSLLKKGDQVSVKFNDTLTFQPTFVEISIADKIKVVRLINTENLDVFKYLKRLPKATIVSKIRLVDTNIQNTLRQATTYYIKTDEHKKQWLYLVKNEQEIGRVNLLQKSIFEYELSSFCWKTTLKRKVVIATLRDEYRKCGNSLNRNSQELEDELHENSFKF